MLFEQLQKTYHVDCFINIAELEHLPSSHLYKTLSPLRQDNFVDNYRFVLFNFCPVDPVTLKHVVKTLDFIDIPHFFVLVVSNDPATQEFFTQLDDPISVIMQDGVAPTVTHQVTPQFNIDQSMCAHAWTGLHIAPDGAVRVCCESEDNIGDYNIRKDSIASIVNSDHMNQIREQFRQGTTPTGCRRCVNAEQAGGPSKRSLTPHKLKNIYGHIDWESDSVDVKFVGGHLGNLCNLKCRICNSGYSSTIAAEEIANSTLKKNHPAYKKLIDNSWVKNSDDFWQILRSQVPVACNFEFLGGEPLLLKDNLEFMQFLLDTGHSKHSIFEFITNGTQYPDILDRATEFERLVITVSIDDLDERFEFQRSGACWDTVAKNLARFVANPNIQVGICITVNIQNVLYLPELLAWIKKQNIDHYYFNILNQPEHLDINNLTKQAKKLVLDKLRDANCPELSYVISRVEQAQTSDGVEFCNYMRSKDHMRDERFNQSHFAIAKAMGYVL